MMTFMREEDEQKHTQPGPSPLWAQLSLVLWGALVLGAAIGLGANGVRGWWLSLVFGALVLGLLLLQAREVRLRQTRSAPTQSAPMQDRDLQGATSQPSPHPTLSTPAASVARQLPPLTEDLSERELEVLHLLASGRTNSEIALDLRVAVGTVKAHVSNIYRKLEVRNRAEAIAKARQYALLA